MWLMKRVMVDRWDVNRALEEATLLGLTNPALRDFMLAEIKKRRP
jgi:hypothetical protein